MTFRNLLLAVGAAVAMASFGANVDAATFTFSLDSPLGNGTGTLQATPDGGNEYLVTSLTGSFDGNAMTLEAPGSFASNDNLLFLPATPTLDFSGISFLAGGTSYNVYFDDGTFVGPGYAICSSCSGGNETLLTDSSLNAVPEPLEWMLTLVGVGIAGAALRARRGAFVEV
jgi:hypothetical protein